MEARTRLMRHISILILISFSLALPAQAQLDVLGDKPKLGVQHSEPKVEVELLADKTGVVPGETVDLAIPFKIQSGWHIYWRNRGEGGMEPSFKWHLPAGFEVGPLLWPPPQRHTDEAGQHTFILEGSPILLTTLKVPATTQVGTDLEIKLDASWLVCKNLCFPGNKSLDLKLKVVKTGEAKQANAEIFKQARARLPLPIGKAHYLSKLDAVANVDKIKPGDEFKVAVVLHIKDDHHLNSHKPLNEFLYPTDQFHDETPGLEIGRPVFPPGKEETPKLGEKLSLYRGDTKIILPVKADAIIKDKQLRISGIVTYQACNDSKNQCYPPVAAEWALTLPVAGSGEAVKAVNHAIFQSDGKPETPYRDPNVPPPPGSGIGVDLTSTFKPTIQQEEHSLLGWLALALLAGLILNVTPCVLPVISIKVLSFVQQASQSPARVFKLGLAFTFGMLLVFNILATMATVAGLAWGQHFQSPVFTVGMATVVFAFALSLFGVYTLGVPQAVGNLAAKADQKDEGYFASIVKGGLATVMGTPCLGPFLGPVLVWASAQKPPIVFLVFNTIGIGMALPYILLTANPKWLRFVPRPGPWLITFKQGMAFLLLATVVYLFFIIQGQLGGVGLVWTLAFLVSVSFACWIVGHFISHHTPTVPRLVILSIALAIVCVSGWMTLGRGRITMWESGSKKGYLGTAAGPLPPKGEELPWVPFSLAKLTELTAAGKPVLLDITADWCPNCQYNSHFVLNTAEVAEAVKKYGVVPMLADWTKPEPIIEALIDKLAEGSSIPLAAVFPAGRPKEPDVMLGILTQKDLIDAIERGGLAPGVAAESAPSEGR